MTETHLRQPRRVRHELKFRRARVEAVEQLTPVLKRIVLTGEELEGFFHLWALNRGVLLTPFHNMALFSPHHTTADVDRHTAVFEQAVAALAG